MNSRYFSVRGSRAQFSLEYLLVLLAFFGALAVIIPSISFASQQFFAANDAVTAKMLADSIEQDCSLFSFLGEGAKKEIAFSSSEKIKFSSNGSVVSIATPHKEFSFPCTSNVFSIELEKKFLVEIEKRKDSIFFSGKQLQ